MLLNKMKFSILIIAIMMLALFPTVGLADKTNKDANSNIDFVLNVNNIPFKPYSYDKSMYTYDFKEIKVEKKDVIVELIASVKTGAIKKVELIPTEERKDLYLNVNGNKVSFIMDKNAKLYLLAKITYTTELGGKEETENFFIDVPFLHQAPQATATIQSVVEEKELSKEEVAAIEEAQKKILNTDKKEEAKAETETTSTTEEEKDKENPAVPKTGDGSLGGTLGLSGSVYVGTALLFAIAGLYLFERPSLRRS
ncbi:hypothetical protein AWH56_008500 [Anaerobacillus isosaccharinicus]|uniref:NEAT domain-containing protein n=1 Tax=Anaerobacillus isosaccharinicus TaxID=1532552 RepID=A0A1S2KUZ8_9BACI|nr:hypothetical protein [Anaerobacillus isosaccharinicus]MBA5583976.1 hypothetical protein [Anaerobacillus isosaccharinicus]QOY37606.1 hypothetical protein AWH56_008500 [Anaerobacillus isosaccharinicus]